jgi:hypothetical protein
VGITCFVYIFEAIDIITFLGLLIFLISGVVVPLFYILATINSKLVVYADKLVYTNWRKKNIVIEINYNELLFMPLGQYGIWIKNMNEDVILKIYGLQWSIFFERKFKKSCLKRDQ